MSPQPPLLIITIIQVIQVITQAGILPIMAAGAAIEMPGIEILPGEDGDIMEVGVTMVDYIVVVLGTAVAGIAVVASDIAKRFPKTRLQNGTGMQGSSTIFIRLLNTLHHSFPH